MGYKPQDEDGIRVYQVSAGSQLNFSGTPGGLSGVLKRVAITNNEPYDMIAEVQFQCRLRTELVNGGRRSDFEGYFYPESTTGATLYGSDRDYVEAHLSGTNNVVSSLEGHPAGEGIQVNGFIIPVFEVPSGATHDVRVRFNTTATPENVRNTVAAGGYVQCLSGLVKLHQKRGEDFDVTVNIT